MLPVGGKNEAEELARWEIVRYTRGAGLDIGRGPFKAFPHFIGVREKGDATVPSNVTPDFEVESFDKLDAVIDGSLDFIYKHADVALSPSAVLKLLKEGGHYCQVTECGVVVSQKAGDILQPLICGTPQDGQKTACVVRYGAIGDAIQTAMICAGLKREGYHVTLMCHPVGEELLRHDKNVDDFWIQDQDQVPNHELGRYWGHVVQKFDRFINLCESVEGTLLAFPGRANHTWPKEVRHKYMNRNYLEFMCEIAKLPFEPEYHFVPTPEERDYIHRKIITPIENATNPGWVIGQKWKKPFLIMWALSGSSVHKLYPHTDSVVAQALIDYPEAHVLFVGGTVDAVLEAGWEKEPRVHRLCGRISIRESMTLAQMCHLVVGPETGVLNGMAFEANAKIVFLSHSSAENLTRDWVNTMSIASEDTHCYPCHRLHMTSEFCPRQDNGTSLCQTNIPPERVAMAVDAAHEGWDTINRIIR